jgi:hypothetical protein
LKTVNGIIGSVLVILGVLSLAGAIITASGTCAKNVAASALLHVPTCDQTVTAFFVLLVLAIVFIIVGVIVLRIGRERLPSVSATQVPSAKSYCHQCGNEISSGSRFCDRCGAELGTLYELHGHSLRPI